MLAERIWAWAWAADTTRGQWHSRSEVDEDTEYEYVRADLFAALQAENAVLRAQVDEALKAALREALKRISALPRGASVEAAQGQEQAYNAILAMIEEPRHD